MKERSFWHKSLYVKLYKVFPLIDKKLRDYERIQIRQKNLSVCQRIMVHVPLHVNLSTSLHIIFSILSN